ncbi:MAG: AMP-dependent synthetase/ligase, partial [Propionibacteriaceae bacterium]
MTATTPTLGLMLAATAARVPDAPAQRILIEDEWVTTTYAEFSQRVQQLAAGLIHAGVQRGDRICLFAPNRPEWSQLDFAIISAGALTVPIFANSTVDQARHIITDSGARIVLCDGAAEVTTVQEAIAEQEPAPRVLSIEAVDGIDQITVLTAGISADREELDQRLATATLDDRCTIIYTSGTTGQPRGAVHSHRSFTHQVDCIKTIYDVGPGDQSLAFLPLAHALERIWSYYIFAIGALNTYCPQPRDIASLLVRARPDCVISVPKLYERIYSTVYSRVEGNAAQRKILDWAIQTGTTCQQEYRAGRRPSAAQRAQLRLADKLVLSSIRAALGGPKKVLISGGAPLRPEIEEFFSAAGMLLGQGYGLTETGPMITFFSPSTYRPGTVGYAIWGSEMTLGENNELLWRGPNLMEGYWNDPEATAAVIDADGWFHTGDLGEIDADGYVRVTDRLKDIIVTTGGKNIAPQPIEGLLTSDPLFEYA